MVKFLKVTGLIIVGVLFFFLIGFVQRKQGEKVCKKINIRIEDERENHFIDEKIVMDMISNYGKEEIIGKTKQQIKFAELEKRLYSHPFVLSANVFSNLNGDIEVSVKQIRPIGRLLSSHNASGFYFDQHGKLLPISSRFSARVIVLTGTWVDNVCASINKSSSKNDFNFPPVPKPIIDIILYLRKNEFWNSQIVQMNIPDTNNIELIPLVGNQKIILGNANGFSEKMDKLMVFYKNAIHKKGWQTYKVIDLKFDNQIICKR